MYSAPVTRGKAVAVVRTVMVLVLLSVVARCGRGMDACADAAPIEQATLGTSEAMMATPKATDRTAVERAVDEVLSACKDDLSPEERDNLTDVTSAILEAPPSAPGAVCSANICFAIDGSALISSQVFALQKAFVALVASLLSTSSDAFYAAVQYAETTTPVEPPTTDIVTFLDSLLAVEQTGKADRNIAAGLGYCGFQLRGRDATDETKGALVIIGSSSSTTGFGPEVIAEGIKKFPNPPRIFGVATEGYKGRFRTIVGEDNPEYALRLRGCTNVAATVSALISFICQ